MEYCKEKNIYILRAVSKQDGDRPRFYVELEGTGAQWINAEDLTLSEGGSAESSNIEKKERSQNRQKREKREKREKIENIENRENI